jgi:hypothetical protein
MGAGPTYGAEKVRRLETQLSSKGSGERVSLVPFLIRLCHEHVGVLILGRLCRS